MSDQSSAAPTSAVARFAERHGINRPRARVAAGLLGAVLLISLFVMNQRITARRDRAAQPPDSTSAVDAASSAGEGAAPRAAWADPLEARRLAGDTLPAVPEPGDSGTGGGEYVPVGRDVGPGGYSEASRGATPAGEAGAAPDPGPGVPPGGYPAQDQPPSPEVLRRSAYQRAVASRRLRTGRPEDDSRPDTVAAAAPTFSGPRGAGGPAGSDTAAAVRPYGAEQAEEDRRAAERAADELVRPRPRALATPVEGAAPRFVFAALTSRPCRPGERILSVGVITATLASAINSEVPGPVLARVGRDVYDAALRCVIIPAGSLLVGRYSEGLEAGEERLVVTWELVVLGDGRSWPLPSLPATDRRGAMGIAGRVDRRTREIFEAAVLHSAFGAAIEYATPGSGQTPVPQPGGYPPAPSARDRAVGAATAPFRGAAERLLDRAAAIRPVLRLETGQPIAVMVPRPVDLDRPAPAPADTVPAAPRTPAPQA